MVIIDSSNIARITYWENYKGQNPNSIGKNILNIGELHLNVSENEFLPFLNFIDNLIIKNIENKNCLDIIVEDTIEKIPSKRVEPLQKQNLIKYKKSLIYKTMKQFDTSLNNFRDYLNYRKNIKGLRIHYLDHRLFFSGFYASFIYLYRILYKRCTPYSSDYLFERHFFLPILCFLYKVNYLHMRPIDGLKNIWKVFVFFYINSDKSELQEEQDCKQFVNSVIEFFKVINVHQN